jgi:hypothetical protein
MIQAKKMERALTLMAIVQISLKYLSRASKKTIKHLLLITLCFKPAYNL